jgi:hypothetical protein
MPSETLKQVLKPRILVMNILWFALTMTILLYVVLAYVLTFKGQPAQPFENSLRTSIYLIAGAVGVLSLLLRSRSLSEGHIYDKLKEEVDPQALATNRETGEIDRERLKIIKSLTPLEVKVVGLTGMYFTTLLISLAMNEVVAIFGLLLAILERRPEVVIPFAVAGILLNLLIFPRFSQFVDKTMARYPQAGRGSSGGF